MKILYGKRIVSALAAVACCTFVSAQETADSVSEPKSYVLQNTVEHVSFKDRWAFKTNALEWILITPNIGVEFDLSNSVYNKWTLSAQVRWNGGSDQTFSPDFDYSIFDGKLELRRYWRSKQMLKKNKKMPKFWRAYYWGVYAQYTDYTLYFKKGYTGQCYSVGGSIGWEVPLYTFKTGALDLDLGLSAGFIYGKYKKREIQNGTSVFVKEQDWHFTPYPLPTEIRVGLVYRFQSIRNKYSKSKYN